MRRVMVLLTGITALLAVLSFSSHTTATASPPTSLQTASIPAVAKPVVVPKPKFTRTMYATTKLAGAADMLDACKGPIAVNVGAGQPVLVAEHNYCGGTAWIPKLKLGDAVELKGEGVFPGIYVVTEIRFDIRQEATVGDLPDTEAVLQTCVTKHKLILVGVNWVGV
jgi:hypothetical protein